MSERRRGLTHAASAVLGRLRALAETLVDPLRADPEMELRLSIPETQTTTIDGDVGWDARPPVDLRCPRCESEIRHRRPRDDIDCPRCRAEFGYEAFPDLELLAMECPTCRSSMDYGRRHPRATDLPEYATCHECRYHWERRHF